MPWGGVGAAVGAGLAVVGYAGLSLWRRRQRPVTTAAEAGVRAARLQADAEAAMALAHQLAAEEEQREQQRVARQEEAEARRLAKEDQLAKRRVAEESRRARSATAARAQQRTREDRERRQREEAGLLNENGDLGDEEMTELRSDSAAVQPSPTGSPRGGVTGEKKDGQEEGQGGGIRFTRLLPPLSPSGTPCATT